LGILKIFISDWQILRDNKTFICSNKNDEISNFFKNALGENIILAKGLVIIFSFCRRIDQSYLWTTTKTEIKNQLFCFSFVKP
jgi:hypothetical protein